MLFSGDIRSDYIMKKSWKGFVLLGISFLICVFAMIKPVNSLAAEILEEESGVLHAFYPAYAVYDEKIQSYIDEVDSISFAWSRIDASNPEILNTERGRNGNDSFYYPKDYLKPVRYAKTMGKPIQLNIYMSESDCTKLLPYSDKQKLLIQTIADSMEKDITQGEEIYYDGVVIDFEGLCDRDGNKMPILYDGKPISTYFIEFLTDLKENLNLIKKKLYVAVNPRLYYDGYDYKEILKIADRVILMAHDYEPTEKLTKDQAMQYTNYDSLKPIDSMAPIQRVRQALNDMKESASASSDLKKVWLQICFDSSQWKFDVEGPEGWNTLKASTLSQKGRVAPLYQGIKNRVDNIDGNTQNLSNGYNKELQTPYIQYYNTSDKTWNIILYEGSNGIKAKINLAKEYGLGGISLWSLSNVPDYRDAQGIKYYLDGWTTIVKEMEDYDSLPADSKKSVKFTDKVVEKAVRDKLGKLTGSITKTDLKGIYRLKLSKGVKSLVDLKNLVNLEYLDASQCELKDMKGIASLTNLRVLYLQRNVISDITPIKKLTQLEILSLNGNQITSISSLASLTKLKELYLRDNKIDDITALSKLKKLNVLELGINKIKKVDALSSLKNLKQLSIENNEISDLKGIKDLTGLLSLNLSNNKISDLQNLKKLTSLEILYLQRNSISDIQVLSGMTKLKELSLNGNKISSLKPLAKLTSLEKLYLKDNKLTSISYLKDLVNLKELYLSGNKTTDYSPVKKVYSQLKGNCDFKLN